MLPSSSSHPSGSCCAPMRPLPCEIKMICRNSAPVIGTQASAPHPLGRAREPDFPKPRLEERHAVVAPEGLALEEEERHAENPIGARLLLGALVGGTPFAREISEIVALGEAELGDHSGDRRGLIDLELAQKEALVDDAAVIEEPAVRL